MEEKTQHRTALYQIILDACARGDLDCLKRWVGVDISRLPPDVIKMAKWKLCEKTIIPSATCQKLWKLDFNFKEKKVHEDTTNLIYIGGRTPYLVAVEHGHGAIVFFLESDGAVSTNCSDKYGRHALYIAAKHGHDHLVRHFLSRGVDVNTVGHNKYTPANVAAIYGYAKIVRLMLAETRIDINAGNSAGWTPLHSAALYGHANVVRVLLNDERVDVNAVTTRDGRTPFQCALLNSDLPTIIAFFQHGIGANNIHQWYAQSQSTKKISTETRIALYQHALHVRHTHAPLLTFHMCRIRARVTADSLSSLRVFRHRWPPHVSRTIEDFLLPSKVARRILIQVEAQFVATLNDHDCRGWTQLGEAVYHRNVGNVRFFVTQPGVDIDKRSKIPAQWHTFPSLIGVKTMSPLHTSKYFYKNRLSNTFSSQTWPASEKIKVETVYQMLVDAGAAAIIEMH